MWSRVQPHEHDVAFTCIDGEHLLSVTSTSATFLHIPTQQTLRKPLNFTLRKFLCTTRYPHFVYIAARDSLEYLFRVCVGSPHGNTPDAIPFNPLDEGEAQLLLCNQAGLIVVATTRSILFTSLTASSRFKQAQLPSTPVAGLLQYLRPDLCSMTDTHLLLATSTQIWVFALEDMLASATANKQKNLSLCHIIKFDQCKADDGLGIQEVILAPVGNNFVVCSRTKDKVQAWVVGHKQQRLDLPIPATAIHIHGGTLIVVTTGALYVWELASTSSTPKISSSFHNEPRLLLNKDKVCIDKLLQTDNRIFCTTLQGHVMVWTKSETAVSLSGVATVGKVVQLQNHDGDVYVLCELQRGPVKQHMVKIWSTEAFDFAHSKHHGVLPMPDDNDDSLLKEGFVRTTRDIDRAPKLRYLRLFNNVLCEYRYKQDTVPCCSYVFGSQESFREVEVPVGLFDEGDATSRAEEDATNLKSRTQATCIQFGQGSRPLYIVAEQVAQRSWVSAIRSRQTLSSWSINTADLAVLRTVEKEGASATVHQAEYRGRQVAAKKYRAIGGPDFVSERTILPYLRHPCIISLIGYVESESSCIIVMPWNEKGSLANAIRGTNKTFKENFNWRQFLRIAYDLADALNYLHTFKMNGTRRPIIHADVSSKNILLNSLNSGTERSIILTDFGNSHFADSPPSASSVVTAGYDAPESATRRSIATDVYAYGVVLWELITLLDPEAGEMKDEIAFDLLEERAPPSIVQLIKRCLSTDPQARPAMAKLLADMRSMSLSAAANASGAQKIIRPSESPPNETSFKRLKREIRVAPSMRTQINQVITQPARGKSSVFVLVGDAGSGKSEHLRIVKDFATDQGWLVGHGRWKSGKAHSPFYAIRKAMCNLRKAFTIQQAIICRSRVHPHFTLNNKSILDFLFPTQMGSQFDEALSEDELWLSFLQLLGLLSREIGPVMLALDDLHNADDSSLRLLDALCDNAHLSHVLIIATSLTKPKTIGKGLITNSIPLLSPGDVSQIINSYGFTDASRDALVRIFPDSVSHNPSRLHGALLYLHDQGHVVLRKQPVHDGDPPQTLYEFHPQCAIHFPDSLYSPPILLVASCFHNSFEPWMLVEYAACERGLCAEMQQDNGAYKQLSRAVTTSLEKAVAFGIIEGKRRLKFVTETARGLLISQLSEAEVATIRRRIMAVLFRRIYTAKALDAKVMTEEDVPDSKPLRDLHNRPFQLEALQQQLSSLSPVDTASYAEMKALIRNASRAAAYAEEIGRVETAHEILYATVDACRLLHKNQDLSRLELETVTEFWSRSSSLALAVCVRLATTQHKLHLDSKVKNTMRRLSRRCDIKPIDPFNLPQSTAKSIVGPDIDLPTVKLMLGVHDLRVRLACEFFMAQDIANEVLPWFTCFHRKFSREELQNTSSLSKKWGFVFASLDARQPGFERSTDLNDDPRFHAIHSLSITLLRALIVLSPRPELRKDFHELTWTWLDVIATCSKLPVSPFGVYCVGLVCYQIHGDKAKNWPSKFFNLARKLLPVSVCPFKAECHLRMAEQTLISILPWDEVGRHLDQAIKIGLSLSQRAVVEQATFYKVYGAWSSGRPLDIVKDDVEKALMHLRPSSDGYKLGNITIRKSSSSSPGYADLDVFAYVSMIRTLTRERTAPAKEPAPDAKEIKNNSPAENMLLVLSACTRANYFSTVERNFGEAERILCWIMDNSLENYLLSVPILAGVWHWMRGHILFRSSRSKPKKPRIAARKKAAKCLARLTQLERGGGNFQLLILHLKAETAAARLYEDDSDKANSFHEASTLYHSAIMAAHISGAAGYAALFSEELAEINSFSGVTLQEKCYSKMAVEYWSQFGLSSKASVISVATGQEEELAAGDIKLNHSFAGVVQQLANGLYKTSANYSPTKSETLPLRNRVEILINALATLSNTPVETPFVGAPQQGETIVGLNLLAGDESLSHGSFMQRRDDVSSPLKLEHAIAMNLSRSTVLDVPKTLDELSVIVGDCVDHIIISNYDFHGKFLIKVDSPKRFKLLLACLLIGYHGLVNREFFVIGTRHLLPQGNLNECGLKLIFSTQVEEGWVIDKDEHFPIDMPGTLKESLIPFQPLIRSMGVAISCSTNETRRMIITTEIRVEEYGKTESRTVGYISSVRSLMKPFTRNALDMTLRAGSYQPQCLPEIDEKQLAQTSFYALIVEDADQLQYQKLQILSATKSAQPLMGLIAIKQPPVEARSLFTAVLDSLSTEPLLKALSALAH